MQERQSRTLTYHRAVDRAAGVRPLIVDGVRNRRVDRRLIKRTGGRPRKGEGKEDDKEKRNRDHLPASADCTDPVGAPEVPRRPPVEIVVHDAGELEPGVGVHGPGADAAHPAGADEDDPGPPSEHGRRSERHGRDLI